MSLSSPMGRRWAVGLSVILLWLALSPKVNLGVAAQGTIPQTGVAPLPQLFLEPPSNGSTTIPTVQAVPVGVRRQRLVLLNQQLLADIRMDEAAALASEDGASEDGASEDGNGNKRFQLNLFLDAEGIVSLQHQERAFTTTDVQRELWIGELADEALGSAVFVVREETVTANIRSSQGLFTIRPLSNGLHLVREIDAMQFPRAADDGRPMPPSAERLPLSTTQTLTTQAETDTDEVFGASVAADDGSVVDVMVAYSTAARVAVGGTQPMLDHIVLVLAEASLSYANSQINTRLQLVHAQETSYNTAGNMANDLERLTATTDGVMDELHTLRNTHGADLVSLWVENGDYCGIAWINATPDYAFSVVDRWCAENTVTFAHELGHNFGARHDWYVDDATEAPIYNKGHVDLGGGWISVMAYFNKCIDAGVACHEILHFSNPGITYNSRPTGVRQGTSTACTRNNLNNPACDAENYRVHNDRAYVVANFRPNRDVADLIISNIDLVDPVNAGDPITYQLGVRNGGKRAAEGVRLIDNLPQGVTFGETSQPTRCTHANGVVTCDFGTLNSGASVGVNITVRTRATTPNRIFNNARVTTGTPESDTANNSDSEGTTVQPAVVDNPLIFVSSTTNGWIGSMQFRDEDILAFNRRTAEWTFIFDGSDVGVTTDVDGFEWLPDGSLLLTFAAPTALPPLGMVDDSDIVRFIPERLGTTTRGAFAWYFHGADVGLTTAAEDIDAIALSPTGNLIISTLGVARVGQWVAYDEDLLEFHAGALGAATTGTWTFYFDGSDVALGVNSEDLYGSWIDPRNGELYFSTSGLFAVDGLAGAGSDIFVCTPLQLGEESRCNFADFWRGADHGFGAEVVDGFALGAMPAALDTTVTVDPAAGNVTRAAGVTVITGREDETDEEAVDESAMDNLAADQEEADIPTARQLIFLPAINR